jgi:hypothetical protein
LVVAGTAFALGGAASLWLEPHTPLPAVLATFLLFGIALGTVNPPITNTAISGMPLSMAGVAGSLASVGRQTGTTLGVAISGTVGAPAIWWLVLALGLGILTLALLSTGRWGSSTAARAAASFDSAG